MFNWAFVIADVNEPILGLDFLRAQELNINPITNQLFKGKTIINCESKSGSPKCYRVEITDPVLRLIEERPTLTDPTNKAVKHNIVHFINTNDEPIKVPNHHYNPKIQNIIKDTFDEYLKLGYVCYSSSEWSSPLAIVPKKGGQLGSAETTVCSTGSHRAIITYYLIYHHSTITWPIANTFQIKFF